MAGVPATPDTATPVCGVLLVNIAEPESRVCGCLGSPLHSMRCPLYLLSCRHAVLVGHAPEFSEGGSALPSVSTASLAAERYPRHGLLQSVGSACGLGTSIEKNFHGFHLSWEVEAVDRAALPREDVFGGRRLPRLCRAESRQQSGERPGEFGGRSVSRSLCHKTAMGGCNFVSSWERDLPRTVPRLSYCQ